MKGATAYSQAHFGAGSGDIFLDDVECTGSESVLLDCTSDPIGTHNCRHHEDAGVACVGNLLLTSLYRQRFRSTVYSYFLFV